MLEVMHREDVTCKGHPSVPYLHIPTSIALILCRYDYPSFLPIKHLISSGGIYLESIFVKEPSIKWNTLKDFRVFNLIQCNPQILVLRWVSNKVPDAHIPLIHISILFLVLS